jgi:hypothetical protein
MSFSLLSSVTYTYPIPQSATTGTPITTNTNLQTICSEYKDLFKNKYTASVNKLLAALQNIVGGSLLSVSMTDACDVTVPLTWSSTSLGDRVCQEGNKAYMHYLKDVMNDLKAFCEYIKAAGDALKGLGSLDPNNGNVNDQAHVLLDKLQCYDQLCEEMVKEFSKHFKYNYSSDTWEEVYDAIGSGPPYNVNSQLGTYTSLDALRKINVSCTNPTGPGFKEISTFNELSKLDKLKLIRLYYNLILNNNQPQTVFPDDLKTGYPCLSNEQSTSASEPTKELGALELFYIGYLIDRDGPINALSSFLEIKTQALRQNISLMMDKIEALNQYLTFLNRGLDLLNTSQSSGTRIPDAAAVALHFFGEGTLRGLKELTINGKKERYLVLQCYAKQTNIGGINCELNDRGQYMLVRADKTGLDFLLGTNIVGGDSNGLKHIIDRTMSGTVIQSSSLGNLITPAETMNGVGIYNGFYYTDNPYGTVDCRNTANHDLLFVKFDTWNDPKVIEWLPKEILVDKVLFTSVSGSGGGWWSDGKADATRMSSWTTAFTNKSEYINTAIEAINNEVSTMRTKIDTFDSASSTFRNRAHDTYSGIVSHIGG